MTADRFHEGLREGLSRAPNSAWIRADLALLGWGETVRIDPGTGADRFDRALRQLRAGDAPLALASFTFDENVPGSVAIVPEVLVRVDGDGTRFLLGGVDDLPAAGASKPLPAGRLLESDGDSWLSAVTKALAAIGNREVEKVVLSRRLTVELDDDVASHVVLASLARAEPGSHTFLVDRFVGSSPELLIALRNRTARSISLAGSADIWDPAGLDSFDNDKMAREHSLAADSVEDALAPFCVELQRSPSRVATYGQIRHLATTFEGRTPLGTTVTDLLSALHPTAAVAGTPTKSALELIRELEGHERGRYAGPVGWFDRSGDGEFAIALRCGMVDGRAVTLYTGAGIVEGSDPGLELEETRIKLRPMLGSLGIN